MRRGRSGSASPAALVAAAEDIRRVVVKSEQPVLSLGYTPARAASAADSEGQSSRSSPIRRALSATASTPPTARRRPLRSADENRDIRIP